MKKKLLALLLATSMVAVSLAGCGSEPAEKSSSPSEEASSVSEEADSKGTEAAEEQEEVTLKVGYIYDLTKQYMDLNEMPAFKELSELTGVNVEWEMIPNDENLSTKINLAFASGEYADLYINIGADAIREYGVNQGLIIPLDEALIEKNMPIYTQRLAEEPTDVNMSIRMQDGKQYSLGKLYAEGDILYNVYFINQEWLDAVGKKAPTSLDELTEVLRAFKTGDPNGNGEADEIPLSVSLKKWTDPQNMLALFGIPLEASSLWMYIDENKELKYAPQQDGFRECMEWMHMLYEEGLLDVEVLSQDGTAIDAKVSEGTVGMFTSWNAKNAGFTEEVADAWVSWTPYEGTKVFRNPAVVQHGVAITDKCENVDAALQWLDAMLEPEMLFTMRYGEKDPTDGLQGWTYSEDGKLMKTGDAREVQNSLGASTFVFAPPSFVAENCVISEAAQYKIDICNAYEEAGVIQKYANKYISMGQMSAEDTDRAALLKTDLKTAVEEGMANFVADGVTDDSWNSFVEKLDEIGAQEYIKIYTDSFATVNIE